MNKRIFLFSFCLFLTVLVLKSNKNNPSKHLKTRFFEEYMNLGDEAKVEYKIYKKLIEDSILDDLIINAGFEPNKENRIIFFLVLARDLRDHIKKSFVDYKKGSNIGVNNFDPSFYYQAEMTRNFYSSLASMGSSLQKSKGISNLYLALGAAVIYFITKFGILGKGIKYSYHYMKAKENLTKASSKTQVAAAGILGKLTTFCRKFIRPFTFLDYTNENPSSAEFFRFLKLFEMVLRDDENFVKEHAKNYTDLVVHYKVGKHIRRIRYPRNEKLKV